VLDDIDTTRLKAALILGSIVLFTGIYLPQLGHGFVKDDFQWLADGRQSLTAMFTRTSGFYRPLVTLSFAFNRATSDLDPFVYGLTNFLLAAGCAFGVGALARTIGLTSSAAFVAAMMWAFNFHGVNMAILWISGRTASFLTLSSILAALTFLHGHRALCLLALTAALLSKEEAVLLPFILFTWSAIRDGSTRSWWVFIPLPLYIAARTWSDAMVPWTAPRYYAFTFEPAALASNLLHYVDRAWTFPIATVLCLWVVIRKAPSVDPDQRRTVVLGAVWFAFAIAITVFLPVRSSLYACWPAVGAAIACAAMTESLFNRVTPARRRGAILGFLLLLLVLVPVYRSRNVRWVEIAELSSETIGLMRTCGTERCDAVILVDDDGTRRNFGNTFGSLAPVATSLFLGRSLPTQIVTRAQDPVDESKPPACRLRIELNGTSLRSRFEGSCGNYMSNTATTGP
jgi:hypothetical protein